MPQAKQRSTSPTNDGATVGYEARLWQMADALRGSMDAAEYKHVVLSLIFLKYISDAFEAQHAQLEAEQAQGADPEDPDEYRALNIFWVPPEARWAHLSTWTEILAGFSLGARASGQHHLAAARSKHFPLRLCAARSGAFFADRRHPILARRPVIVRAGRGARHTLG